LVPECQAILSFTAGTDDGGGGGDSWNSETRANHLHLAPVKSPPPTHTNGPTSIFYRPDAAPAAKPTATNH